MSYESPITTIIDNFANKMNANIENRIYQAVLNIGIDVNKKELIRALQYDRNQYEKGYADGRNDAITHAHWLNYNRKPVKLDSDGWSSPESLGLYCSRCHQDLVASDEYPVVGKYCPNCGAKMDEEVTT